MTPFFNIRIKHRHLMAASIAKFINSFEGVTRYNKTNEGYF